MLGMDNPRPGLALRGGDGECLVHIFAALYVIARSMSIDLGNLAMYCVATCTLDRHGFDELSLAMTTLMVSQFRKEAFSLRAG